MIVIKVYFNNGKKEVMYEIEFIYTYLHIIYIVYKKGKQKRNKENTFGSKDFLPIKKTQKKGSKLKILQHLLFRTKKKTCKWHT